MMDLDQKLGKLSDRELILFVIGETRHISRKLDSHIDYHAKQDDRHWRIYLILFGVSVTTIAGLAVTLLVN